MKELGGLELVVEQTFRALGELDRENRAIRRPRAFPTPPCRDRYGRGRTCARCSTAFAVKTALSCARRLPQPITNDTFVDIGHEALIRRWDRMGAGPCRGQRAEGLAVGRGGGRQRLPRTARARRRHRSATLPPIRWRAYGAGGARGPGPRPGRVVTAGTSTGCNACSRTAAALSRPSATSNSTTEAPRKPPPAEERLQKKVPTRAGALRARLEEQTKLARSAGASPGLAGAGAAVVFGVLAGGRRLGLLASAAGRRSKPPRVSTGIGFSCGVIRATGQDDVATLWDLTEEERRRSVSPSCAR